MCYVSHYINREMSYYSHVKWEQNSKAVIVLQAFQIEVLFEVVKSGISNIGAIQETESIAHR